MATNSSFLINKSLSFNQLSTAPLDPNLWEIYSDSVSGELLQWNGGAWVPIGSGSVPTTYWQGYTTSDEWSTTSSTFVDPTIVSGSSTLTQVVASGLVVSQAAGNIPGVTFTPVSASDVYIVSATSSLFNPTNNFYVDAQLTDGTTQISLGNYYSGSGGGVSPVTLKGVYAPGTTSPVTVKIQIQCDGGTATLGNTNLPENITWTILKVAGGVATPSPLTYWSGYHSVGYSWNVDTTGPGYFNLTNTAVGTFTQIQNSGFGTVTTASSNAPGITFTPASQNAVYLVMLGLSSGAAENSNNSFQLTDGTNVIGFTGNQGNNNAGTNIQTTIPLIGFYTPGTTSPVTLTVQGNNDGSTGILSSSDYHPSISWTLVQLNTGIESQEAIVAMQAALTTTIPSGGPGVVVYDTVINDTDGGYNISTGLYTVQPGKSGYYRVSVTTESTASSASEVFISINGVTNGPTPYLCAVLSTNVYGGSQTVKVNEGDTIGIYNDTALISFTGSAGPYVNFLSIEKLPG